MIGTSQSTRRRLRWLRDAIVAQPFLVFLVFALSAAVLALFWAGNRAFAGWRRSDSALAEHRAEEEATLLSALLHRDMTAVQGVLGSFGDRSLKFRHPYDLFDIVVSAFSRYPYVDSIFVWRPDAQSPAGHMYVFNRADRPPVWADAGPPSPFPVALAVDPHPLMPIMTAIRASKTSQRFLVTETTAAGNRYQVVASLFFDRASQPLAGAVGFLTDLTWVRQHYFVELLKEIEAVIGEGGVNLSIFDEHSTLVATQGSATEQGVSSRRQFPLAFFDGSLVASQGEPVPLWTLSVTSTVHADSSVQSWNTLWWLLLMAAVAALVSIILTAQSVRAIARNAEARSEFVASVTHDLKTPLALIAAVGDTLESGRNPPDRRLDEYGRILRLEGTRLRLRIDNLLMHARAHEAGETHRTDVIDLLDVIQESLHRAEPRLAGFEVDENLTDTPLVIGDHEALVHIFDNLIDNAIKYSTDVKHICIQTATQGGSAVVTIQDRGIGIAPADITQVFERFFRGRSRRSGSGLGLSIVRMIVEAHGGTVDIASALGGGTTVTVTLPLGHAT